VVVLAICLAVAGVVAVTGVVRAALRAHRAVPRGDLQAPGTVIAFPARRDAAGAGDTARRTDLAS
jgi:hypothetical protein